MVLLVGSLLVANYASSRTLRDSVLRQRAQQAQLQAATVSGLLGRAVEDVRNLADSREVAAFHENRDLGMSMEYGLAMSLVPIHERLEALTTRPRGDVNPAFSRLVLLDAAGVTLVDSAGPGAPPWPEPIGPAAKGVRLSPDGRQLAVVHAVGFKGRSAGALVAWLRPEPLRESLAPATGAGTAQLLDLAGQAWRDAAPSGGQPSWPALAALAPDGQVVSLRGPAGESAVAVKVRVPGQPFSLLQVDRAEALLGGLSPAQSAMSFTAVVVAVLGAALIALYLNTKALVLQAHLDESLRREREVGEKHQALEREVAERQRLEKSRALLARAVDQAGEAIAVTDAQGRFEYVNPAFERITCWSAADILGRSVTEASPELLGGETGGPLAAAVRMDQDWKGECSARRRDGSALDLQLVVSPVHDGAGATVSFVTVARDVTEENRLREQLRHSQKLEAVGTLAGGVAHDFNNLLAVINGYAASARRELPEGDGVREDLDEILRAGKRAADLVRQLLAFGRRQPMALAVVDLDVVVAGVEKMLRRLIREDIELSTRTGPVPPWVKVDQGQLEQVLINLVVNARDAMPAAGRISISTDTLVLSEEEARLHPEAAPGSWVRLRVEDDGAGMDEETLRHLFEPYFTTKEVGKGSGLGLSMVHGIVHQCLGFIQVSSHLGRGSVFDLYLPAAEASAGAAGLRAPATAEEPVGRPEETVLLVEDEDQLLKLLRAQLTAAGFTVLGAVDGIEALELTALHHGRIDVLLSDVVMPRLGGFALADRLRTIHPEALVVFMSGHAGEGEDQAVQFRRAAGFVQKPQGLQDLPVMLRRLLNGRRGSPA
jgi:PAS domain S-box-containing protein